MYTEESKVLAKKSKLGWSVNEAHEAHHKIFDIKDSEIQVGEKSAYYAMSTTDDIEKFTKERSSSFTSKFGISCKWLKFGVGFGYDGKNKEEKNKRKTHTIVDIFYITPCALMSSNNSLEAINNMNSIGTGYIKSGKFLKGYQIIIDADLLSEKSEKERTFSPDGVFGLSQFLSSELGLGFEHNRKNESAKVKNAINVEIRTIGGLNVPNTFSIKAESLDEEIKEMIECLIRGLENEDNKGIFTFEAIDKSDYDVNSTLSKLENICNELKLNIDKTVNFPKREIDFIEKEISNLIGEINTLKSIVIANNEKMKEIGESILALSVRFFEGNPILIGEYQDFKLSETSLYLIADRLTGEVRYSSTGNDALRGFKIESAEGLEKRPDFIKGKSFLLSKDGAYLSRGLNNLQLSEKKDSSLWLMDDVSKGNKNLFQIRSEGFILGRGEVSDSGCMLSLCHEDMTGEDSHYSDFVYDTYDVDISFKAIIKLILELPLDIKNNFNIRKSDTLKVTNEELIDSISKKESDSEKLITRFVHSIFPKLYAAKNKSLILLVGIIGSGKSTLTNYMLGHDFEAITTYDLMDDQCESMEDLIKLNEVNSDDKENTIRLKNMKKPHAVMSGSCRTATLVFQPFSIEDTNLSVTDSPGLRSGNELEDKLNAFSMLMVKEMSESTKAIVVVIDHASLDVEKGRGLENLVGDLSSIMRLEDKKFLKNNLFFVFNTKGKYRVRNTKEIITKLLVLYKTLQEENNRLSESYRLSESVSSGFIGSAINVLKSVVKSREKDEDGNVILTQEEKLVDDLVKENQLKMEIIDLIYYCRDNIRIFDEDLCENNKKFRETLLGDFSKLSFIDKQYIRYNLENPDNQEFLMMIDDWVEKKYSFSLSKHVNNIKVWQDRIDTLEKLRRFPGLSKEGKRDYFSDEKRKYAKKIEYCYYKLKSLNKKIKIQDVKLIDRESRFFWDVLFRRRIKSHTTPYYGYSAEKTPNINSWLFRFLNIKRERGFFTEFRSKDSTLVHRLNSSSEKASQKSMDGFHDHGDFDGKTLLSELNLWEENLEKGDHTDEVPYKKIKKIEDSKDIDALLREREESLSSVFTQNINLDRFNEYHSKYQAKKVNTNFRGIVVGELWGLRGEQPAYRGHKYWYMKKIKELYGSISDLGASLSSEVQVDEIIQVLSDNIKKEKEELMKKYEYFSDGYVKLKMIHDVVNLSNGRNLDSIKLRNLDSFIKNYQMFFIEKIEKNLKALSTSSELEFFEKKSKLKLHVKLGSTVTGKYWHEDNELNRMFFMKKLNIAVDPIINDRDWYKNEHIEGMLEHYFSTNSNVDCVACMPVVDEKGVEKEFFTKHAHWNRSFRDTLIDYKDKAKKVANNVLIPINLNGNHWVGILMQFSEKDQESPKIYYFNSFGPDRECTKYSGECLKEILLHEDLYPNATFIEISEKLQDNSYDCGPWLIESMHYLVIKGGLPENKKAIGDMQQIRRGHARILENALVEGNTVDETIEKKSESFSM